MENPRRKPNTPGTRPLASTYIRKPGVGALAAYVVLAAGLAAGINALIVFSESAEWTESLAKPRYALTGVQIGVGWELMFAFLALAIWFVRRTPPLPDRRAASTAMTALVIAVLSFPFYAILPQHMLNSFVGTLGSAFIAWVVTGVVFNNSRKAGLALMPLSLWLSYYAVVTWQMYRLNPEPILLGLH
jgi:tryptophan-rich sensory protein